jgi:hypothetical protein
MRANNSRAVAPLGDETRVTVSPAPALPLLRATAASGSPALSPAASDGRAVHTPEAPAKPITGSAAQLVEISKAGFARAMSAALQKCYPTHHAVADDAGATSAAAKNWWLGRNAPDGYHYYCLIAMNPALPMAIQFAMDAEIHAHPGFDRNVARVQANAADEALDGGFCGQE